MTRLTGKMTVEVVDSDCILMHSNHMGSLVTSRLQEVHLQSPGQLPDLVDHFVSKWPKFTSRTTASNCIDFVLLNKAGSGRGFP